MEVAIRKGVGSRSTVEKIGIKLKFILHKLKFRKVDGDLKYWLSFWKKIHTDENIEPENNLQYLI